MIWILLARNVNKLQFTTRNDNLLFTISSTNGNAQMRTKLETHLDMVSTSMCQTLDRDSRKCYNNIGKNRQPLRTIYRRVTCDAYSVGLNPPTLWPISVVTALTHSAAYFNCTICVNDYAGPRATVGDPSQTKWLAAGARCP